MARDAAARAARPACESQPGSPTPATTRSGPPAADSGHAARRRSSPSGRYAQGRITCAFVGLAANLRDVSDQLNARVGYRAAFGSREFRALLTGQLISVGGTSVAAVALTILVYRRTESPLLASLTFALAFLPYVLGGGLLSSVVDRVRPRRLVAGCDTVSALLAALMAWPAIPVPVLFALLLAIGTLSSISGGARAALVRSSVTEEAYVPARSLLRIAVQFAQIGGNAGGGVLLLLLTTSGALLVNSAYFAFSAAAVRLVVE